MTQNLNIMRKTTFLLRTLVLSVVMLVTVVMTVKAEVIPNQILTINDVEYVVKDKELRLVELGGFTSHKIKAKNFVVPETIEYEGETFTVKSIVITGNENIQTISIPRSVEYVRLRACKNLEAVNVEPGNKRYYSRNGILFYYEAASEVLALYPPKKKGVGYSIPYGVDGFDLDAFADCYYLISLTIPSTVEVVGDIAMNDALSSLQEFRVDERNKNYSSENGVLFNKDRTELICYPASKKDEKYRIPYSVREIRGKAFNKTNFLTSLFMHRDIDLSHNEYYLANCKSIQSFEMEEGNPFYYSEDGVLYRKHFNEDGEVVEISLMCFPAGKKVTKYKIPSFVNRIIYFNNKNITSLFIPKSVNYIWLPFNDTEKLVFFEVDKDNEHFSSKDGVLFDGSSLIRYPQGKTDKKYSVPATTSGIREQSFRGCIHLEEIDIPASVDYIQEYAFFSCESLKSIRLYQDDVEKARASNKAFAGFDIDKCTLYVPFGTKEKYKEKEPWTRFKHIEEFFFDKVGDSFQQGDLQYRITSKNSEQEGEVTVYVPEKGEKVKGDVVIPSHVKYGFGKYTVTAIDDYGFAGCDNLTSLTIPKTIKEIGKTDNELRPFRVFQACFSLKNIIVDKENPYFCSVDGVLYNKNKTKLYHYPAMKKGEEYMVSALVKEIKNGAFSFCKNLQSIKVDKENTNYTSQDGVLFNKEKTELIKYPAGNKAIKYTIPNGVKIVKEIAFALNENLTSVDIPSSVDAIKSFAFARCYSLRSVVIPNGVKAIEDGTFQSCISITTITIPKSVTYIGENAFDECRSLIYIICKIENPENVLRRNPFYGINRENCTLYVPKGKVNVYKNLYYWEDFENIKEIGTSLKVGDKFEYDGIWYEVTSIDNQEVKVVKNSAEIPVEPNPVNPKFEKVVAEDGNGDNYSLTSVIIPSVVKHVETDYTVTIIGVSAFASSKKLTSVTIPKTVTTIENNAFENCTSLKSITVKAENINNVTLGDNVFKNVNKKECTLHVPTDKTDNYKEADQWKEFDNIVEDKTGIRYTKLTNPISVVGNNIIVSQVAGKSVKLYSLSGQVLHNLHATQENITLSVNKAGAYILKVGNGVRKVVVN